MAAHRKPVAPREVAGHQRRPDRSPQAHRSRRAAAARIDREGTSQAGSCQARRERQRPPSRYFVEARGRTPGCDPSGREASRHRPTLDPEPDSGPGRCGEEARSPGREAEAARRYWWSPDGHWGPPGDRWAPYRPGTRRRPHQPPHRTHSPRLDSSGWIPYGHQAWREPSRTPHRCDKARNEIPPDVTPAHRHQPPTLQPRQHPPHNPRTQGRHHPRKAPRRPLDTRPPPRPPTRRSSHPQPHRSPPPPNHQATHPDAHAHGDAATPTQRMENRSSVEGAAAEGASAPGAAGEGRWASWGGRCGQGTVHRRQGGVPEPAAVVVADRPEDAGPGLADPDGPGAAAVVVARSASPRPEPQDPSSPHTGAHPVRPPRSHRLHHYPYSPVHCYRYERNHHVFRRRRL